MRVISLYLPNWPIERLARSQHAKPDAGKEKGKPFILAQRSGTRRLVYAANTEALAAGTRPGMDNALDAIQRHQAKPGVAA